jgi:membrane-associated phospholipid phosphatase
MTAVSARRTWGVALALLLATGVSAARAQEVPGAAAQAGAPGGADDSAAPSFKLFGRGLLLTFGPSLFHRDTIPPLVVGMVAAGAISTWDQDISDHFRDEWPALGDAGQVAGGTGVMAATTIGLVVASKYTDSSRFKKMAFAFAQSIVVENTIVQATKFAVGRERPDGSNHQSFPSGHSADTFTLATVVTHYYGWKWGTPFYAFAGLVAASRIEKGKHWPSDTVAGATIGLICAQAGIRTTERLSGKPGRTAFLVQPYAGPRGAGILVDVTRPSRPPRGAR